MAEDSTEVWIFALEILETKYVASLPDLNGSF